jgi:electron transfer flavoprotein alpha subunit
VAEAAAKDPGRGTSILHPGRYSHAHRTGVDALFAAGEAVRPAAVLVLHSTEGREVAARYAVRTKSALAVDAVGVSRDDQGVVAFHSVYGGAYDVTSAATFGPPVITLRHGDVDVPAQPQPLVLESLAVPPSTPRAAVLDAFEAVPIPSNRPELRGASKVVSGVRGLGSPSSSRSSDSLPMCSALQ